MSAAERRRRAILALVVAASFVAVAVGIASVLARGPTRRPPDASAWALGSPSPAGVGDAAATPGGRTSAAPPPLDNRWTDRPGWRLLFADAFDQTVPEGQFPEAVGTTWAAYPDTWRDTSGNGHYSPDIVSIHDGVMNIHLRTEDGITRSAAPVPLIPGGQGWGGQLYGRYAVRFRADPVPGYKTAWLLWPVSEVWPRDGEIDFPEGDLDGRIEAYVHHQGATAGSDQVGFATDATYDAWHTAVIEWTPGSVRFFLDGRPIGTTSTRIPNTAMRWVLQTETALSGEPPPANAEGHVYIDWVAVWAYAP